MKSGSVDEYGQMQGYIKSLIETCNYYKANKPMLKSATAAGDIYLSVANQKVVYSASKWYYEFDVNANSGLSGTFLQNIFLELDYSKTAFGANISSGSKVTPTKLGVYNNSYYNISHMDMTDSRVLIILSASDASGSFNRSILPTSSTSVFHVKMEILPNLNPLSSGLAFYNNPIPFALGFSYTTTANAGWTSVIDYAKVNYTAISPINVYSLAPVIGNISPLTVNAGCEEVITITGSNFGSTKGKVFFKNADDGGQTYINDLDQTTYIVSWTNTEIKVKVPSFQYDPTDGENKGAGTGPIIVKSSTGAEKTSTQTLTVNYSLLNVGAPPTQRVDRLFLAKMNCDNGIEFSLGEDFRYNSNAESVVLRALQDWSTKMGITLIVERDASNNIIYRDNSYLSSKNLIYLDYSYSGVMETPVAPVGNASGTYYGTNEYYRANADIRINPNKDWHYPIGDQVSSGYYDFYHAILHEIGHVLGLDHVNDPNDLMYWQYNQTIPHPASSRKNLNNTPNTITGALSNVNDSKSLNWTNPAIAKLVSANPSTPTISASGAVSFCSGSVTLTSSATSNNKWYESGSLYSSNSSITISNTGSFYVTTTLNACTIQSTITNVTVCPSIRYYVINNGESITRNILRYVKLNNIATNRPTQFIASENSSFSGASWCTYDNDPKFKLSSGWGLKTVYFKVRNAAGESPMLSDQILYQPYLSLSSAESETLKSSEITNEFSENSTISLANYEFSEESMSADYDITAYPVPCVDKINIVVPSPIQGAYKVTVIDINGSIVLIDNINSERKSIDLSGLQHGTYIIRLHGNEKIYVKKIIKY